MEVESIAPSVSPTVTAGAKKWQVVMQQSTYLEWIIKHLWRGAKFLHKFIEIAHKCLGFGITSPRCTNTFQLIT